MFSPGEGDLPSGPNEPPLCEIAPWNSPLARGDAQSMLTAMPPADSPKIVTLSGSPPNAAMLLLDPLQARDLVHQAVVAGDVMRGFRAQLGVGEEAEGADAIRDADEHDAASEPAWHRCGPVSTSNRP